MSKAKNGGGAVTHPKRSRDPRYLYVVRGLSIREIVAALQGEKGSSRATIERRCREEKWPEERERYRAEVAAKTAEKAAEVSASPPSLLPSEVPSDEGIGEGADDRQGDGSEPSDEGSAEAVEDAPATAAEAPPPVPAPAPASVTKGKGKKAAAPAVKVTLAPPEAPPPSRTAWDRAMDAAIEYALELEAQEFGSQLAQARQMWQGIKLGAQRLILDANKILASNKLELAPTGDKDADGDPEMAVQGWSDTTADERNLALRWLKGAAELLGQAESIEPLRLVQQAQLELRKLAAEVKYLTMRVEGTLPPDKVAVEFKQQLTEHLADLEQSLAPEEFGKVLASYEKKFGGVLESGTPPSVN